MNEIVTKQFLVLSDWEHGTVSGVASTADIDRMGDIVAQDFDLSGYEQNPVMLYNHNRDWVIGSSGEVTVGRKRTHFQARYASKEASPLAQEVRMLAKEGHFTGKPGEVLASVSFRPGKVEEIDAEGNPTEDYKEVTGLRFSNNQLIEISLVSIPANLKAKVVGREAEFPAVCKVLNIVPETPKDVVLSDVPDGDDEVAAGENASSPSADEQSVERLDGAYRGLCGFVDRVRSLTQQLKEVTRGRDH